MSRVSIQEKNANPEVYGYPDPKMIDGNWVPFKDQDGDLRFIPCTYEFYKTYTAEQERIKTEKSRETRCLVKSKRYKGLVRCMANCDKCPYDKIQRDHNTVSLDYLIDEFNYEPAFNQDDDREDYDDLWESVSTLKDEEQKIIRLYSEGYTDVVIADKLNLTRSCVKKRRQRAIEKLKEKLLKK